MQRWARRAVTGPGLMVLAVAATAVFPICLMLAAAADVWARRWNRVRFVLLVFWAVWMHVIGLVSMWGTWVVGGRWLGMNPRRQLALDKRTQGWWARWVWRGAESIYGMRIELIGEPALEPGGFVMMSRHASIIDTILPMVFLGHARGYGLRYVIKRELLWDPCVDIAGDRFPTAFVRRGGRDHATEIARVKALLEGLEADDVVVIYPEGTRFTEKKRERVLGSLRRKQPEVARWAETLRHLLPPHPGGAHALLRPDHNDIVFCAHTGLEPANHLADMFDGSLIGVTVQMQFWRVAAGDVPADPAERQVWLQTWWARIDAWIEAHRISEGDQIPRPS